MGKHIEGKFTTSIGDLIEKIIEESSETHNKKDKVRWLIIVILLVVSILALYLDFVHDTDPLGISDTLCEFPVYMLISIAPELAGMIIGVFTIDYLNERRQDKQLKRQLILQVGSRHNDVADTAIRTLQSYGWISDGTLKNSNLYKANLEESILNDVDLTGSILSQVNLEEAKLKGANLAGSILSHVNLKKANLEKAILTGAMLWYTDMTMANLKGANFKGLRVYSKEQFSKAESLEGAIMPDGRLYEEWILDDEEE